MQRSMKNILKGPFAAQPGQFFWLGPQYAAALRLLREAILEQGGVFLLTGEKGTGKTTLASVLAGDLDPSCMWAMIGDAGQSRQDFYLAVAQAFGIEQEVSSKVRFLLQFSAFLHRVTDEGRKVVLAIDDCQGLAQEILEEIRHLANLEKSGTPLVNLLLIGRPEFLESLARPNNRALGQRVSGKAELVPFTLAETREYIRHRLKTSGMEEELFTDKAVRLVYDAAGGSPRLTTMVCDQVLRGGAAVDESSLIGRKSVEEAAVRLGLEPSAIQVPPHPSEKDAHAARPGLLARSRRRLLANPTWRWSIYILPVLLAGAVGFTLLPEAKRQPVEQAVETGEPEVLPPAVLGRVDEVLPPAVGRLEPIGRAIDLDMPAGKEMGRRETEGQKAEEEGSAAEEGRKMQRSAQDFPASRAEPLLENTPDEESMAAGRQAVKEPLQEEEPAVVAQKDEMAESPPAELAAEKPPTPPLQPARIVLPLRPNSLELTEAAARAYRELVEQLEKHPEARLVVKGFVSAKTNSPENIKLSEERAMAVQRLLVKSGIDPARITVRGMGNQEPLASNDTSEGRAKNRRVEVEVESGP